MADIGVRYVLTLQDLASNQFRIAEQNAQRLEGSISSLNNTLRSTASAFGVGLGLHSLVEFGKSVIETTAQLEGYQNLIKFSSRDITEATKNQEELNKVVSNYKLPLIEVTDQYSRFLAAVKGTSIEGEQARKTFDDMALTLGVMHLPAERAGRALYAVQEMFSEGRVQTRHFVRQLAAALPGSLEVAAETLGVSIPEFMHKLAAKAGSGNEIYAADFLPKFFENFRKQMEGNLPVALQSFTSQITDLSNAWLKAKESIGEEFKPEFSELINKLKEGAKWVKENKEAIKEWAEKLTSLIKIWVEYKAVMLLINLANEAYLSFQTGFLASSAERVVAINSQTVAYERLNIAMQQAVVYGSAGLGASGIPLMAAGTAVQAETAAVSKMGMGAMLIRGAIPVAITYFAAEALSQFLPVTQGGHQMNWKDYLGFSDYAHSPENIWHGRGNWKPGMETYDEMKNILIKIYGDIDNIKYNKEGYPIFPGASGKAGLDLQILQWQESMNLLPNLIPENLGRPGAGAFGHDWRDKVASGQGENIKKKGDHKIVNENDKITGQRVITYNITIKEMGNIGKVEVNNKKDFDYKEFKDHMSEVLLDVVNDSQLRAGD